MEGGRKFPGGPVVRTRCFHCWGLGSIPGQRTRILQGEWCGQKEKEKSRGRKRKREREENCACGGLISLRGMTCALCELTPGNRQAREVSVDAKEDKY